MRGEYLEFHTFDPGLKVPDDGIHAIPARLGKVNGEIAPIDTYLGIGRRFLCGAVLDVNGLGEARNDLVERVTGLSIVEGQDRVHGGEGPWFGVLLFAWLVGGSSSGSRSMVRTLKKTRIIYPLYAWNIQTKPFEKEVAKCPRELVLPSVPSLIGQFRGGWGQFCCCRACIEEHVVAPAFALSKVSRPSEWKMLLV